MTIARMPKFPVALAPNVSITEYVNPSADEYDRPCEGAVWPRSAGEIPGGLTTKNPTTKSPHVIVRAGT